MKVIVFTDASCDDKRKLAACGYVVLLNGILQSHTVYLLDNVTNSLEAEMQSVFLALKFLRSKIGIFGFDGIVVKTDCKLILRTDLRSRLYDDLQESIRYWKERMIPVYIEW